MTLPKLDKLGGGMALGAAATWGMAGIFIRWLPGWSLFAILTGRFLIATTIMMSILLLLPENRQELSRSLRTAQTWWLSLPLIGGHVFGTAAFQLAPVGEVTLLLTTSPLFVIVYKLLVGSGIYRNEGIGMALAIAGSSWILLPQFAAIGEAAGWPVMAGYGLALGAAGTIALYTIWLNQLTRQGRAPKSIHVVFVTFLLGSVLSLMWTGLTPQPAIAWGMNGRTTLTLVGLGIVSTVVPLWCYTIASQRLSALMATAILLLEPVFATLFASVALQEIPTLRFYIGSGLVLAGLLFIAKTREPQ